MTLLDDVDAALGGDQRRVDVVHRLLDAAAEGAVQRREREQARVVLGELTVVGERDLLRLAARELERQTAEARGQRDVRAEHLEVLGAHRGGC